MRKGQVVQVVKTMAKDIPPATLATVEEIDKKENVLKLLFPLLGVRSFTYKYVDHLVDATDVVAQRDEALSTYEKGRVLF